MVNRRVLGKLFGGNLRRDTAANLYAHHAVVRHAADGDAVQVPLLENRLDFLFAAFLRDKQHAFLRFAEEDLVRRHSRLAFRHQIQVNLIACAATAGGFAGRTREPRRAHVLDANHKAVGAHHFEARLKQQFLHEWIAHLHRGSVSLRFLREFPRRERGTGQPVATGRAAHIDDGIADARRFAALDLVVSQHAQRQRVDQRVAIVRRVEIHFTAHRRDPDAVAVVGDPRHDARE